LCFIQGTFALGDDFIASRGSDLYLSNVEHDNTL
jgi:hypothetical protein